MGKTSHEYRDSLWNINSIWTIRNVISSHREIVPIVWRLNQCGKRRKDDNSEHPPYSPDLAPSNFQVFLNSTKEHKEHLCGRHFCNNGQVQTVVLCWFRDKAAIFYRQFIECLVECSDKMSATTGRICREKVCCMCVISHFSALLYKVFLTYNAWVQLNF